MLVPDVVILNLSSSQSRQHHWSPFAPLESYKYLNKRMEELRISSDDLDEALCIIENYKILKLEKFAQGKFSQHISQNSRYLTLHASAGVNRNRLIESSEKIKNASQRSSVTKILKTETCSWLLKESWTASIMTSMQLIIGQVIDEL